MPPVSENGSSSMMMGCTEGDICCIDPESCSTGTNSPIGVLETVDASNWKAKGWTLDTDNPGASLEVHFYIDGPSGVGTLVGQTMANLPRADINAQTGYGGDHGFEFTIPNQYLDGSQHTLYAYSVDTGDDGVGVLSGSPKSFVFSPNSVPPQLNAVVNFEYDAAGNRVWMTDAMGRTDYEYDELSRLKSETRAFSETLPNGNALVMANAPLANNGFKLQYEYGLANQLTKLTDPFGAAINYGYDSTWRLKDVTGTNFGGVATYASNAEYEAWGGLKTLAYGSGLQMQMNYNNRLQAASYNLTGGSGGQVMSKQYEYYADGNLRYVQNLLDARFDRLQTYDHLGRIKEAKTGLEARGGTVPAIERGTQLPYRQSYEFNAFNNLKQRNNLHWGIDEWNGQNNNLSYSYRNNRIEGAGWTYDADGRNLQSAAPDDFATSVYNAAGQMVRSQIEQTDAIRFYDGNGREVKRQTATSSKHQA